MERRGRISSRARKTGLQLLVAGAIAGGFIAGTQIARPNTGGQAPVAAAPSPVWIATSVKQPAPVAQPARAPAPPTCGAGEALVELSVDLAGDGSALCLPISIDSGVGSRIDPVYTRAANIVIGNLSDRFEAAVARRTVVVCWNDQDWKRLGEELETTDFTLVGVMGFVSPPSPVINISPKTCRQLDGIAHDGKRSNNIGLGKAVGVLAHEAMHVAGIADEAAAECYGVQLTAAAASELGADADYAAKLQELNWRFDQEYWADGEYSSAECRDGGELDLDPEGSFSA